jgi:hypothetical protein
VAENIDPVEEALQSLRERNWPGGSDNHELENRLMQAHESNRPGGFVARHRVLVPVLAVLLLGSVVFAAAGGVEVVKGWFMTMTIEVGDEVIVVDELEFDENGHAVVTLPEDAVEAGEEITVTLEGERPDDDDGELMTTLNVTVDGNVAEIEMEVEDEEGGEG